MKPATLLCLLATAASLLLILPSCKKSAHPSAVQGSMSFEFNGQLVSMTGFVDTTLSPGFVTIWGHGKLPGSNDSSALILAITNTAALPISAFKGLYTDTSAQIPAGMTLADADDAALYSNETSSGIVPDLILDITVNNGRTISGTFSGTLYRYSIGIGGANTYVVSNGVFSVNY